MSVLGPVAVIVNRLAKRNRRNYDRSRLRSILGGEGRLYETTSDEEVEAAAREIRDQGMGLVAISGGDGTYQRTLTTLIHTYGKRTLPLILPLRGGTFNALARHVTPRGEADRILAKGVETWRRARKREEMPRVRFLPILRVEVGSWDRPVYGFLWANGLIARIVRRYNSGPKSTARGGRVVSEAFGAFVLQTPEARQLFSMWPGEVFIDGSKEPFDRYLSLLAGVLDNTILGMTPFEKRFPSRRSFKFLSAAMEVSELFGISPALLRGRKWNADPRLRNALARRITVRSEEAFMLDGEMFGLPRHDEVEVTLGPLLRFPRLPGIWTRVRSGQGASSVGRAKPAHRVDVSE